MRKEYKHSGETFWIEDGDECELKVSDDLETLHIITPPDGLWSYMITGTAVYSNDPKGIVDTACTILIQRRAQRAAVLLDPCRNLTEFFESI